MNTKNKVSKMREVILCDRYINDRQDKNVTSSGK